MCHRTSWMILLVTALMLVVVDCSSPPTSEIPSTEAPTADQPTEPAEGEVIVKQAVVDGVELLMMESFPLQMRAIVRGNLPDGCTEISRWEQSRDGNTIRIELSTTRPIDAICTQALVPYEESIPVDIMGLPAGEYAVSVNGVEARFTLDVDNVAQEAE